MISANGGLPAHRYTPQVTPGWPRGSELASPGCGATEDGRSPTPDLSSVRPCGRGPLPSGCGCGGCGRGDPSPTPQRALLRAGFARCGGGMRVPGGGASCLGVGRPWTGALPPPTSRLFGRAAGAHYPLAVGAGDACMGTRHQPHSARLCVLWGRHEGVSGGRPLPGREASGVGRSPTPNHSSFRACGRRPLPTGCGSGGCVHGDPSPTPQRALLRAGFARCGGRHEGARGGRLLPGCGASKDGRSPTPDLSSVQACGRGPPPTSCGCGGCGRGAPSPTPQRALLRSGFARCEGGMRVPGGGASCLGVRRRGTGALPPPTSGPIRRAAGAHYPLAVGAGACGRGDPSPTPQRALLSAVGAAWGCPGGDASCLGVGRPGSGALPTPTTRSFGLAARAHYRAGQCTRLPADPGGHRCHGAPPCAAPPGNSRRPPRAQSPEPRPGLESVAQRVGRVARPPPAPVPVDGQQPMTNRGHHTAPPAARHQCTGK